MLTMLVTALPGEFLPAGWGPGPGPGERFVRCSLTITSTSDD